MPSAARIKSNGTTTAGMMVLRFVEDDEDVLLAGLLSAGVADVALDNEVRELDKEDAAAAGSELYCAGSVTTDATVNVLVDNPLLGSVMILN
jgi:hypothetical protein